VAKKISPFDTIFGEEKGEGRAGDDSPGRKGLVDEGRAPRISQFKNLIALEKRKML